MGAVYGLLLVVLLLSGALVVLLVIMLNLGDRGRDDRGEHVNRDHEDHRTNYYIHVDVERDEHQQGRFCCCSCKHAGDCDDSGDVVSSDSGAAEERGNYQHGDDLRKDGHGGCAHVPEFTEEVSR